MKIRAIPLIVSRDTGDIAIALLGGGGVLEPAHHHLNHMSAAREALTAHPSATHVITSEVRTGFTVAWTRGQAFA